jgi:outer membrane immunogenic protein
MLRKLTLAAAATAALSTGAMAADIPVDVPAAVPVAYATYNWTGFYIGANLGYTWLQGDAAYTGTPGFLAGVVGTGFAPGGFGLDANGVIGGAQLGYNIQFNQFVVGVEADFMFADAQDSLTVISSAGATSLTTSASTRLNWLGTVRGRVGVAFDRFLVYGTGGFAYGDVDVSGTISGTGLFAGTLWSGSTSSTRTGWTLGAGVEWAFSPNITARLEYLYYDLGDVNVSVAPQTAAAAATGVFATQRHEIDGHLVRAGVNFRF